jgi:hypothetical protein
MVELDAEEAARLREQTADSLNQKSLSTLSRLSLVWTEKPCDVHALLQLGPAPTPVALAILSQGESPPDFEVQSTTALRLLFRR